MNLTPSPQAFTLVVENISCVLPQTKHHGGLFIGNYFGAKSVVHLEERGIRAVLTTSVQTPILYLPERIPIHKRIQAHDRQNFSIMDHFEECLDFIEKGRKVTNVFVHCYAGVSRSASIVIAYLMRLYGWPYETAFSFLKAKRSVVNPNEGFVVQLKAFERRLKQEQKIARIHQQPKPKTPHKVIQPEHKNENGINPPVPAMIPIQIPKSAKPPLQKSFQLPKQHKTNDSAANKQRQLKVEQNRKSDTRYQPPRILNNYQQGKLSSNRPSINDINFTKSIPDLTSSPVTFNFKNPIVGSHSRKQSWNKTEGFNGKPGKSIPNGEGLTKQHKLNSMDNITISSPSKRDSPEDDVKINDKDALRPRDFIANRIS